MARIIETALVTTYAKRAAALKKSKKKQDALRDFLIAEMQAGAILSTDGPYIINIFRQGGKDGPDWKLQFEALQAVYYQKMERLPLVQAMAKARRKVEELEQSAPEKEAVVIHGVAYVGGVRLEADINPTYRRISKAVA